MGNLHSFLVVFIFSASLTFLANGAAADRIEDALAASRNMNRPLLAIGTTETCEPCRALHQTLRNDTDLQPLLAECVVLSMNAESAEFSDFVARFPADARMVPMVYVVLPNGNPMYAQSGGLTGSQLSGLIKEASSYCDRPSNLDLATFERVLESARSEARKGHLIQALHAVDPMANMSGSALQITKARSYQKKLTEAINQWLLDLDQQMSTGDGVYGAAYRVAELYVELPEHKDIHETAGELLRRYQGHSETKNAVLQAKNLLKARFYEDHQSCEKALENYGNVVRIDASTPAAGYARDRMSVVQEKLNRKKTASRTTK